MSSLKVSQIKTRLRALFEAHLNLSDVPAHDVDREEKVLSRCLAALAVYLLTGCSAQEAAEAVWDGSDDNGIDAAYFDPSASRVLFVQSKWMSKGTGEPAAKDIGAFTKGVRDAIESNQENFHQRLQGPLSDISLRLTTPGTFVHLVIVSTGASALAKHGQSVIKQSLEELNGEDPDAIASSEVMGLAEVYSGLSNDARQGAVTVDATLLEWSFVPHPYPAFFGIVDGLSLKEWWKKHGKGLVAQNIRHSLGSTDVNKDMMQTALSAPENFWYFNNGITLVAEEAAKAPAKAASRAAGNFSFKAASVVNGAQTVSSLARVDNDDALGKVRVPIRVVLLGSAPPGFGNEVTRTNNFQNRIEPRDFVAQDPQQRRLRLEMAMEGIDYQFVRGEDANTSAATTCDLIEVTTALACAAGDSNLAVQLKTGIGRFFNDLGKAPYKALFNPSVNGAVAFNATLTLRAIEGWIEARKKTTKKSGPRWGVLIHGNRILAAAAFKQIGWDNLSRPIADFQAWLPTVDVSSVCVGCYTKITNGVEEHYPSRVLAVLFKNPRMSKHLFDLAS